MASRDIVKVEQSVERKQESAGIETGETDPRQRALAMGLEFSKRALEAESLDDLFFLLTNDARALLEFDRAFLITHLGGKTRFAAASNQPVLEKKSRFNRRILRLGNRIKDLDRGLLLSASADSLELPDENVPPIVVDELRVYMDFSGCQYILCIPFNHRGATVGHLVLEFLGDEVPGRIEILTLLNMAPFFGAALTEQWFIERRPGLKNLVGSKRFGGGRILRFLFVTLPITVIILALALFVLFAIPMDYTVGGESEVAPHEKHVAFAKIDGLVKEITVTEGSAVKAGEVLATLDRKELDYEIKSSERRFEILTKEMSLLRREAGENPAKLAESKLVALKRKNAFETTKFLRWKSQFLEIKAPVGGIVVTKDVRSLAGKRFKAGEPFCEIAVPGDLWVHIMVPEEKIAFVAKGQEAEIYLNSNPREGFPLKVAEIAPVAEVLPRLGNVFRVASPFLKAPEFVKVGMKGIGKIYTGETNLWFIITQRLSTRWNQLMLYF